jgi:prepilin-type N-terminal cleavage/methylation domain-containing protein
MRRPSNAGFTLAELLVATLLSTLVMSGVYFSFSSSIRLWRNGERDLQTYQDARTSMTIMSQELMRMLEGAGHLMEGDDNEIAFYAVTPPFDPDEADGERILWIRYRVRPDASRPGDELVREERLVESPMPKRPKDESEIDTSVIKHGRKRTFELASGVLDFELTYLWTGEQEESNSLDPNAPLPEVEIYELDEHREGDGIPQGIRISLTLADQDAPKGRSTFTTYAIFQGPTDEYEAPGEEVGTRL